MLRTAPCSHSTDSLPPAPRNSKSQSAAISAVRSGLRTRGGLCGLIGVWTGWVSPSEEAIAKGAAAMTLSDDHFATMQMFRQ